MRRLGLGLLASGAALVVATRWALGRRFRCAALRRHRWGWVRGLHTVWAVHSFARRLELACRALPAPVDATAALDGGGRVLAAVLAEGVDTFQRKPSNLAQTRSSTAFPVATRKWWHTCAAFARSGADRKPKACTSMSMGSSTSSLTTPWKTF